MDFDHELAQSAFSQGLGFASQLELSFDEGAGALSASFELLEDLYKNWSQPTSQRFVQVFTGNVAIAAAARLANAEPALTRAQLTAYFEHSWDFFNSLRC